ncbi:unnamed protein product [Rotaria sp. Silwood2]|nr:unnamed protein product [Rotaria sp. Silwood2]CAF4519713.1 unnamed protein product [Rotaria sp. Silwood2]
MNLQFNISNDNNNRRTHMSANRQRKNSHPYRKFQTGSTTTFSGYTNISNYNHNTIATASNNNNNNNYHQQKQYYNNNNITHLKASDSKKIPCLMSVDLFQQPPRKNRRKIQHAEQYKQQTLLDQHEITNTNQYRTSTSTLKKLNGLILSDSMCNKMLTFLEKQNIDRSSIFQADFVLFSLCTNDVANLGPELAIKNCRILIERVRQLFPHLKSIGWLALSPRSKPSKLFNSITINENYQEFNQYLNKLSKEVNFKVIDANLQHQHMHCDGLDPSIQSGRVLIEKALYNWFVKETKHFSITSYHQPTIIANHHHHNYTTIAHNNNNKNTNNSHHHNSTTTTTNNNNNNRALIIIGILTIRTIH